MTNDNTDRSTRDISYNYGSISDDGYVYDIDTGDEEIIVTVTVGSIDSQRAKSSELDAKTEMGTKKENQEKEKED